MDRKNNVATRYLGYEIIIINFGCVAYFRMEIFGEFRLNSISINRKENITNTNKIIRIA